MPILSDETRTCSAAPQGASAELSRVAERDTASSGLIDNRPNAPRQGDRSPPTAMATAFAESGSNANDGGDSNSWRELHLPTRKSGRSDHPPPKRRTFLSGMIDSPNPKLRPPSWKRRDAVARLSFYSRARPNKIRTFQRLVK